MTSRSLFFLLCALLLGAGFGFWLAQGGLSTEGGSGAQTTADGPCPGGAQPAYWVAPMDASYRRDAPGKSPMGMDLVPKCEADEADPSQITVSAASIQNLGVRTALVERTPLSPVLSVVGSIAIDPTREVRVHSRAEGWVQALGVSGSGDPVATGDSLYQLFSPKFYSAESDFLAAAGNAGLQAAAAERLRALGYRDAQIKAVRKRGKASDTVRVQAASAGLVTALAVRPGQYVQPGTHLMTVARLDRLWMLADVEEGRVAALRPGSKATVRVGAYPGEEWTATVERRSSTVDATTRTLALRLVVDNSDGRLHPGMFARASIALPPTPSVISVPVSSVIRDGQVDRVIKALGDGRFAVTRVALGQRVADRWEIREGLSDGERVVIQGQFMLDTEAQVEVEALRIGGASADPQTHEDRAGEAHDHDAMQTSPRGDAPAAAHEAHP